MPNVVQIPAAGAFDPTDIEITDGVDDAFLIKDTSGDEWFKIDTRTGTGENCINMAYTGGQKVLIGKPNSASNGPFSPLQVVNGQNSSYAVRLYGDTTAVSDNQFAWGRDNQQTLWVHPLGGRFDSASASGSFDFRNSSALTMFTMADDTNATYVIDYDAAAENRFVVGTNRTGGSGALMSISSRNAGLGNIEGVFFAGPATSQVWVSGPSVFRLQGCAVAHNPNSGNNFRTSLTGTSAFQVYQTTGDPIMNVDADSNTTFTFEDGSGATFTITDDNATPKLHFRCTQSAAGNPYIEVNGVQAFPTKQLTLLSSTYGTAFQGSINQSRLSVSLGATSTTRNINIGAVNMDVFAQILTATPSTTGQTFTLEFNNTSTALSGLPIGLYKIVLKNAGTESCTFTAASTMASGGRVKGVDISGASIGVIDSSSGSITAAAGETIYVEVTNHVSDSAGGNSNRFIICKTICKI